MGSYKQKILRCLFNPILSRNRAFIGKHQGETCYIFGNGASLKNMELRSFSDHPAIGLNFLCIHNDFKCLDTRYYVLAEPFFFYSFIKNPYIKQYQSNIMGQLFNKAFSSHPHIALFTSISNIFGAGIGRTYYLHHFGNRTPSRGAMDICGEFSFMNGALYAGIGLAINLGFKKAYLVGCDYLFSPMRGGHFYSHGPARVLDRSGEANIYDGLLNEIDGLIDLIVITDTGVSDRLPSQDYHEFKNGNTTYMENIELVNRDYLDILNKAYIVGQFTSRVL